MTDTLLAVGNSIEVQHSDGWYPCKVISDKTVGENTTHLVEYANDDQFEVDLKSPSSYRSSSKGGRGRPRTSSSSSSTSTTEKPPKKQRTVPSSSSSSSSASSVSGSAPPVPTLPVGLQRQVALLGSARVIEKAVQDIYLGVPNEAFDWIDVCFTTLQHHYPSTWKLYLTCRSVNDASKLQLIVALATIKINGMEEKEVAEANEKMKQKNGGVYFKERE